MNSINRKWKRRICVLTLFLVVFSLMNCIATEIVPGNQVLPSDLYARSAVLMDAGSGRILFSKNGNDPMPMASTTKIMTCIIALENKELQSEFEVSETAAAQPKVRLGMRNGEKFHLEDLLYSLMLESHNDSAYVIAEGVGGSVDGFAKLMNEKAKQLKCKDTLFITPNGLDAENEQGNHHTTAADLARIMKYCIKESPKKEEFIKITSTDSYSFTDVSGKENYHCVNHNALLKIMEGAVSGKTGFTGNAGYCYVGAVKRDDRTFIVALLACGWPNNKGYKWSDTQKLMNYGFEQYYYKTIAPSDQMFQKLINDCTVEITNGYTGEYSDKESVFIHGKIVGEPFQALLKTDENVSVDLKYMDDLKAPIQKGQEIGVCTMVVGGEKIHQYSIVVEEEIKERNFKACLFCILNKYLAKN